MGNCFKYAFDAGLEILPVASGPDTVNAATCRATQALKVNAFFLVGKIRKNKTMPPKMAFTPGTL